MSTATHTPDEFDEAVAVVKETDARVVEFWSNCHDRAEIDQATYDVGRRLYGPLYPPGVSYEEACQQVRQEYNSCDAYACGGLTQVAGQLRGPSTPKKLPAFPASVPSQERTRFLDELRDDLRIPSTCYELNRTLKQLQAFAEWQRRWKALCTPPQAPAAAN